MPDGFDAGRELERIWNLRDLMIACRVRMPDVMERVDRLIKDPDLTPLEVIAITNMLADRGYGKPRQHLYVSDGGQEERRVRIVLPDNGRSPVEPEMIEARPGDVKDVA